jgi:hypothetical protein
MSLAAPPVFAHSFPEVIGALAHMMQSLIPKMYSA